MNETGKLDGASGDAPQLTGEGGAVICIDAAEARLMRKRGHRCVTSAKVRNMIMGVLETRAPNAPAEAAAAVARLGGVSSADAPDRWSVWEDPGVGRLPGVAEVRAALQALPVIPTLLADPADPVELGPLEMWRCQGTTILVARDTFEAVRAADTYAGFKPYRPQGRMDEPFTPHAGRVCIVTEDEIRLLRLNGLDDAAVVLTWLDKGDEGLTGPVVTPRDSGYPTSIRALVGEHPGLAVGRAGYLAAGREGYPFFLGLTRGMGFESSAAADLTGAAALAWRIQTNRAPEAVSLKLVLWAGGDDVRQLVRYGGLTIFTGRDSRRKVQLRSLGLARSGLAAGVPIYDLAANYQTLTRWAVARTFQRPGKTMRDKDQRRVRWSRKALHESTRGTSMIHNTSPWGIRVTPSAKRRASSYLRSLEVCRVGERGVTTVPLKTLLDTCGDACKFYLNGRPKVAGEWEASVDPKRWPIRCVRWMAADPEALLGRLQADKHVALAGRNGPDGSVFAVVRVANGTEDQQREAVGRWAEAYGREFPRRCGSASLVAGSNGPGISLSPVGGIFSNWGAESLQTAQFERYSTAGDYAKASKIDASARRRPAVASKRAKSYARAVEGLNAPGTRNTALAGALLNIRDKFGREALEGVLSDLLARSTLPEREKRRVVSRILNDATRRNAAERRG